MEIAGCAARYFAVRLQLENHAYAPVPELDRLVYRVFRHRAAGEKVIVDHAVVAAVALQA